MKFTWFNTQRRLAMAGKILFPIPKPAPLQALYRLAAESLVLWGASDRLIVPVYAERWKALIRRARVEVIEAAGHALPYEQPDRFVRAVSGFLR